MRGRCIPDRRRGWVVGDDAAFVGADLILIDDPFQSRAIAQSILKHFGRDSTQSHEVVVDKRAFVFAQLHLFNAPVERLARRFDSFERILELLFVVDMNLSQAFADVGEGVKVRCEGNARA